MEVSSPTYGLHPAGTVSFAVPWLTWFDTSYFMVPDDTMTVSHSRESNTLSVVYGIFSLMVSLVFAHLPLGVLT
nr:MAG TPA: hypothetical protein [Caudoviricetes sp.]